MEKNSSLWAYVSAGASSLFGFMTLEDFALWVGIVTAIGTALWNWYVGRERLRLLREKGRDVD